MHFKKDTLLLFKSFGILVIIAISLGLYFLFQPHRDVQKSHTDYTLTASNLVAEYLKNEVEANKKYLDTEGDSKILEIRGFIASIEKDFNQKTVVLLKKDSDLAGVSCTLLDTAKLSLKIGQEVKLKGVIRSGAAYDKDLDMYENVVLEQCQFIPF